MWFVYGGILIGLLLLCMNLYSQNSKLQQRLNYYEPMVKTVENVRDILYYCETVPKLNYLYLSPNCKRPIGFKHIRGTFTKPREDFRDCSSR